MERTSEHRLISHESYLGRTAANLPRYFQNLGKAPLKPAAVLAHIGAYAFQITTDLFRLLHKEKSPVPSLNQQSRTVNSISNVAGDAVSAIGDVFRGRFASAFGKAGSAVTGVGDVVFNLGADLADQALNADDYQNVAFAE